MMVRKFSFAVAALVLSLSPVGAQAPTDDDLQRSLIAVLESDAPSAEKALVCKQLAIYGGKQAVPALAKLLTDKELASWSRIALEVIPDSSVDVEFRRALGELDGRLLLGVINSIGVRQDRQAVEGLTKRLSDANENVAAAAAVALGKIGDGVAAAVLADALTEARPTVRSAVAEGCVLCAEKLLERGQREAAAKLYEKIRHADVPWQRKLEATRGTIVALGADDLTLLAQQLAADDKRYFQIALSAAREMKGREVTDVIVQQIENTFPGRQVVLISALAAREDAAALPAILQLARNSPESVRIAALAALHRAGDASCVEDILEIAVSRNQAVAEAARDALAELADSGVNREITERLSQSQGATRRVLIELIGLRRIDAVEDLLKAADDDDTEIRTAALAALGSTVGPEQLEHLIRRVTSPARREDLPASLRALREAAIRMPDRDSCADQLAQAMTAAPAPARIAIVDILGSVGGSAALEAVASAAESEDPEMRDAGTRLLGQWMTADAAPALLKLSENAKENKYRIRALRGYIRIARQFVLPEKERAQMCRAAWGAAKRDAEKELILAVLERYPHLETLQVAVEASEDSGPREAAAKTVLAIVQKIGGNELDAETLFDQLSAGPVKLEIVQADYGAGEQFKDVTAELKRYAGNSPLIVLPTSNYNDSLGGDPLPGKIKQLNVRYRIDGETREASYSENSLIWLK